ncbi:MAG TPA: hypothetical protein VKS22_16235 [Candidatus Binataceae bacterium]|nr:hypothetical protein [Candidatus Binataceae bacterium]
MLAILGWGWAVVVAVVVVWEIATHSRRLARLEQREALRTALEAEKVAALKNQAVGSGGA